MEYSLKKEGRMKFECRYSWKDVRWKKRDLEQRNSCTDKGAKVAQKGILNVILLSVSLCTLWSSSFTFVSVGLSCARAPTVNTIYGISCFEKYVTVQSKCCYSHDVYAQLIFPWVTRLIFTTRCFLGLHLLNEEAIFFLLLVTWGRLQPFV